MTGACGGVNAGGVNPGLPFSRKISAASALARDSFMI
jgi:hypothetical protein